MGQKNKLEGLSKEDLAKKISELKKELIKAKGQSSTGATQKNPYVIKNNKKGIARILTELNKRK